MTRGKVLGGRRGADHMAYRLREQCSAQRPGHGGSLCLQRLCVRIVMVRLSCSCMRLLLRCHLAQ